MGTYYYIQGLQLCICSFETHQKWSNLNDVSINYEANAQFVLIGNKREEKKNRIPDICNAEKVC